MNIKSLHKGVYLGTLLMIASFALAGFTNLSFTDFSQSAISMVVSVIMVAGLYILIRGVYKTVFSISDALLFPLLVGSLGLYASSQVPNTLIYLVMYFSALILFFAKSFAKGGCFEKFGS